MKKKTPPHPGNGQKTPLIPIDKQKKFESDTKYLNTDERESVVKVRYGQGDFREALIKISGEKCWMSGIEGRRLLVASHIKPWSHCSHETESRGSPNNGLLLSSLWDAAFDSGLITIREDWRAIASSELSESAKTALGLDDYCSLPELYRNDERSKFLAYHRSEIFKK